MTGRESRVRALIADDEPLLREALITELARTWPELRVVAGSGRAGCRAAGERHLETVAGRLCAAAAGPGPARRAVARLAPAAGAAAEAGTAMELELAYTIDASNKSTGNQDFAFIGTSASL